MRKVIASVLVVLSLTAFAGVAMARNDDSMGGGYVSTPTSTFAECCKVAANNYIAAKQQPPSTSTIQQARALQRMSIANGVADPALAKYWPAGQPMTATGFPSSQ